MPFGLEKQPTETEIPKQTFPEGTFERLRDAGKYFASVQKYQYAIESLTKALEVQEENTECLITRAKCFLASSNTEAALADCNSVLTREGEKRRTALAVYLKAEALYQTGDFESALIYYHRGNKLKANFLGFSLGIQKARDAINNSIGTPDSVQLKACGDLSYFHQEDQEERTIHLEALPKQKQQKKEQFRQKSAYRKSAKATKQLIGELYSDKVFLEEIYKNLLSRDVADETDQYIQKCAADGIEYLSKRAEFWRQQNPVYAHVRDEQQRHRRPTSSRFYITPIHYVLQQFEEIDGAQACGKYKQSLKKCQRMLEKLDSISDEHVRDKPLVEATIYSFMGNACMELKRYVEALEYHNKDFSIGREKGSEESETRALDNIARTRARMGEYQTAIDIFTHRLARSKSELESMWLCHEIGRCYLQMGRTEEAKSYGNRLLELAQDTKYRKWQLHATVLLAQSDVKESRFQAALNTLARASALAKELGDLEAQAVLREVREAVNEKRVWNADGKRDEDNVHTDRFTFKTPTKHDNFDASVASEVNTGALRERQTCSQTVGCKEPLHVSHSEMIEGFNDEHQEALDEQQTLQTAEDPRPQETAEEDGSNMTGHQAVQDSALYRVKPESAKQSGQQSAGKERSAAKGSKIVAANMSIRGSAKESKLKTTENVRLLTKTVSKPEAVKRAGHQSGRDLVADTENEATETICVSKIKPESNDRTTPHLRPQTAKVSRPKTVSISRPQTAKHTKNKTALDAIPKSGQRFKARLKNLLRSKDVKRVQRCWKETGATARQGDRFTNNDFAPRRVDKNNYDNSCNYSSSSDNLTQNGDSSNSSLCRFFNVSPSGSSDEHTTVDHVRSRSYSRAVCSSRSWNDRQCAIYRFRDDTNDSNLYRFLNTPTTGTSKSSTDLCKDLTSLSSAFHLGSSPETTLSQPTSETRHRSLAQYRRSRSRRSESQALLAAHLKHSENTDVFYSGRRLRGWLYGVQHNSRQPDTIWYESFEDNVVDARCATPPLPNSSMANLDNLMQRPEKKTQNVDTGQWRTVSSVSSLAEQDPEQQCVNATYSAHNFPHEPVAPKRAYQNHRARSKSRLIVNLNLKGDETDDGQSSSAMFPDSGKQNISTQTTPTEHVRAQTLLTRVDKKNSPSTGQHNARFGNDVFLVSGKRPKRVSWGQLLKQVYDPHGYSLKPAFSKKSKGAARKLVQ